MVPLSWIDPFGLKDEVSDNSNSYDGARKNGSSSKYSSFESEEKCNDGFDVNLMGDDNDQTSMALYGMRTIFVLLPKLKLYA